MINNNRSEIGECPLCGAQVYSMNEILSYNEGGDTGVWANCPECDEVVDPILNKPAPS